MKRKKYLTLSYLLTLFITIAVYITGGTRYPYAIFMTIPVIIATSTNKKWIGIIHAIFCGLLLGPLMPLDVELGTPQITYNWIIRLLYFIIISVIVTFFKSYYNKERQNSILAEKEVSDSHLSTIYALVKLSESRDDDTGNHLERVSEFCKLLTTKLSQLPKYKNYIDDSYIDNIYKASTLHDIGKVGIPDQVLLKPSKLTVEEFEIIKRHTTIGSTIISEIKKRYEHNVFLDLGFNIIRHHHERWDGKGYPDGLAKEEIPLSARIMAITDVYDALRSKRSYKNAYSHEDSIGIIKDGKGTQFDPEIVDVFLTYEHEFKTIYEYIMSRYE
jgi:response regulator RpfG family c-di-GMP phosphodiesterase